ncbi:MAG: SDR family oxidoreductase [Proteobacteria bacterium]|nr:SDR family oxidoreductase [Pseudomonadota bacterium]MBU1452721.1 SDR family oxidoreductase [Pseudomonadota bacterium]MBU2467861.1 SDR family oxidoreductase [Pseudomonadota bacterium]MBU2519404.1 SDR family oxidoreductase [Pseudomonadota bacterium]
MDLGVKGKSVFINGGGEGIGVLVAQMLAQEGANIALADLNVEKVQETAAKVKALGGEAIWFEVDVTNQAQVEQAVHKAIDHYGKIDILVHIPGRGERKPFQRSNREDWDFALNLNLMGPLYSTKAVIDNMIANKGGSIVYVVSDAGRVGEVNNPVYSAAKGGVIAFSKSLARELGRHLIRVNCVALSAMDTPGGRKYQAQIAERKGITLEALQKGFMSSYLIRRFGRPQDAADAICFLCSTRADWITGQTLSVNGGYSLF